MGICRGRGWCPRHSGAGPLAWGTPEVVWVQGLGFRV